MTDEDPKIQRYTLPDAENARIFNERIVPSELSGRTPRTVPTIAVLIGQPGAGKSRVSQLIASELDRLGGYVDVDSDAWGRLEAEFRKILKEQPGTRIEYNVKLQYSGDAPQPTDIFVEFRVGDGPVEKREFENEP